MNPLTTSDDEVFRRLRTGGVAEVERACVVLYVPPNLPFVPNEQMSVLTS